MFKSLKLRNPAAFLFPKEMTHRNRMFFIHAPAGDVWSFSVYQPTYDPAAANGHYWSNNLYMLGWILHLQIQSFKWMYVWNV